MDYKYSFVYNNVDNSLYALVMTCWYINEEGIRVDVKSENATGKTLDECFELAKQFTA